MDKDNIIKKIDEINEKLSDLCNELNKWVDYEIELNGIELTSVVSELPKKQYHIVITTKEVLK